MGLRQSITRTKYVSRPVLIGVGVVLFVGVLLGAYVYAGSTKPQRAERPATETTIPRIVADPSGVPTVTQAPILPGPEYGLDHGEDHDEHSGRADIEHGDDDIPDYSDRVIPTDQLPVVFPRQQSQLTTEQYDRASEVGAAYTTALVKGVGRERFPTTFPSDTWPDPLSANMVVDYSHAQAVPSHPSLIRSVVVWHGTTSGGTPLQQVRISHYLQRSSDGALTPLRLSQVPDQLQKTDGLLSGVSILG